MTTPLGDTTQPITAEATARLTVTRATLEEWRQVEEWAAAEGWNPGRGDTDCFHPTDPAGFFLGRLDGRPVSAVSVVTYSERFAFLGYYLVHPELRRRGLGLATWRAAWPHGAGRTVGLDAVPAQESVYQRSGFTAAYRTHRYTGHPTGVGAPSPAVVPVTADLLDELAAYDRECFPAERRAFLARWLTAPGRRARVFLREGRAAGYGMIRPAREGLRIGPLFADTPEVAEELFDALTAGLGPADQVSIDIPEPQPAARGLAEARGLTPGFHTVRMYAGQVPGTSVARTYGVTSLELG
ncbi:GCN5 family acetyltransferase [Streptomyces albus subsp. albus]|nr:GCN5 family acetyltransferase [Streptomyces albus subsp. albus]